MQNSFSEALLDIISRSNISKNELIRECDIDRSSFFKILNGTRIPTAKQFAQICCKLKLSPADEKKLRTAYSKITLGERKVQFYDCLTELLWIFENTDETEPLDISKPFQKSNSFQKSYNNEVIVSGKRAVFELFTNTILQEAQPDQEPCEIFLFLPILNYDFVNWIISFLKTGIGSNIRIKQLIELSSFPAEPDPVIIERIKLTFLCAAANIKSYSGYYYYSNSSVDSNIGVFCAYSLITPNRVIMLNKSMDKAIIITDPTCCNEFRHYSTMALNSARPLIKKVRSKDLTAELNDPISYRYGGKAFIDKQFEDNSIIYISPRNIAYLTESREPNGQNDGDTVRLKEMSKLAKELKKRLGSRIFFIDERDIPSAMSWYIAISGDEKLIYGKDGDEECLIISESGIVKAIYGFMVNLRGSGFLIRDDLASEMIEKL